MAMPARLAEIVEEFADLPAELRLEALLDYSRRVPPLPERLAGHRDAMEQVPECQTPFFLATELGEDDRVARGLVDGDVGEAGLGQHGPGQLLAPGRAQAGPAGGQ